MNSLKHRTLSILLLFSMLVSVLFIPAPVLAQYRGVTIKAGLYNFYNVTPTYETALIMDNGILRIIIDRTAASEVGTQVHIGLIYEEDEYSPAGGYLFNISNINEYAVGVTPGGVIDLDTNGTLYNEYGVPCGNVTKITRGGKNYTIIWIDLSKIESLENVTYITNIFQYPIPAYIEYRNLYNRLLRVRILEAGVYDSATSDNTLRILHIPIECSDVAISVYDSPAIYGQTVTVRVSLEKYFDKIENAVGIRLNVSENNLTQLYMLNYYNTSEVYSLVNFTNGIVDIGGDPAFLPLYVNEINESTFEYVGQIDDFAPTEADNTTPYLSSYYMFKVYFRHEIVNETVNLTFTIEANSTCASTESTPFLRINASLFITTYDIVGDFGEINPGDIIDFYAHNVPEDYLDNIYYVYTFNLTNTTYGVNYPLTPFYLTGPDGTIFGSVTLPELPYGGIYYQCYLVFTDYKWITNSTYLVRIDPYTVVYVLTEISVYAEDTDGYYLGNFVYSSTPEAAPGDYIVIEGHGFNLYDLSRIKVNILGVNATILNISTNIPALTNISEGRFLMLVKLIDESTAVIVPTNYGHGYIVTGTPIAPGTGVMIVGELGTSNTDTKPFTVTTGFPYNKTLFNPDWYLNDTGYYINHTKLGYPYTFFNVFYQLVPYPGAVNDVFIPSYWQLYTWMEVIGWTTPTFELKLYNKNFSMVYNWLSIGLTNGYVLTDLYNVTIPFLPYGDYTLLEETIPSVNNRTVFTVYMGIDVDVSPCRNGTFNVTIVGGAPYTEYNLTFNYQVYELIYNWYKYTVPYWTGEFNITVVTDRYGYGSTSEYLVNIYNTSMVTNVTWDMIVYLRLNGTGTLDLWFLMNGTWTEMHWNGTIPAPPLPIWPLDVDYETEFYVNATYNVTVTRVAVDYLPETWVTVSVTHTALPGDKITVQIFPHNDTDVWNLLVISSALFEEPELVGWYLDVRLVDPYIVPYGPSAFVDRVTGYYAGKLVVGDVDGDGVNEIWFTVNLTAPLVFGEDKTYRVDVKLFLAVLEPETNVSGVEAVDLGCRINVSINGTIYWRGYGSDVIVGSDMQTVDVLGIVYAKLEEIINNTATLEAKIDDLTTYIKTNVTELLNAINNTVVLIKNDTAYIRVDLATIKANITTIIDMLTVIDGNVRMILTCCGDVMNTLNRMEATLNETHDYVLWIDGNLTALINTVNTEVIPKFYELYGNLSVLINSTRDYIVQEITNVNNSLSLLIISAKNELENMINYSLDTVLNAINASTRNITMRIDDLEATLIAKIESESSRLELLINLTRDDLNTTITNVYNSLVSRIERCCSDINDTLMDLKVYMENSTGWIIANITDANRTIHERLTIILDNLTTKLDNINESLSNLINNALTTLLTKIEDVKTDIIYEINDTRTYLEGVIISAKNETLRNVTIELRNVEMNLNNAITTAMNTILTTIGDAETDIIARINDTELYLSSLIENESMRLEILINVTRDDLNTSIYYTFTELMNKIDRCCGDVKGMLRDLKFYIGNTTAWIVANITDTNNTIHHHLDIMMDNINTTLYELREYIAREFNETFNKLDMVEANIIYTINSTRQYLEGVIYDVEDDVLTNITITLDNMENTLTNLINTRVDELKFMINDNVTTILARISNVNMTIVNMLNELNVTLYDRTAWIMAGLISMNTSLTNLLNAVMNDVDNTRTAIMANINDTRATLVILINDTLRTYIRGEFNETKTILANLRSYIGDEFTNMENTLNTLSSDLKTSMSNMNKTLVDILTTKLDTTINTVSTKLDDTKKSLEDKLKATSETLSSKLDSSSKRLEDAVSSVNGNLTLFSAAILLLEIIILALSSFLIMRRPAG